MLVHIKGRVLVLLALGKEFPLRNEMNAPSTHQQPWMPLWARCVCLCQRLSGSQPLLLWCWHSWGSWPTDLGGDRPWSQLLRVSGSAGEMPPDVPVEGCISLGTRWGLGHGYRIGDNCTAVLCQLFFFFFFFNVTLTWEALELFFSFLASKWHELDKIWCFHLLFKNTKVPSVQD